MAEIRNLKTFLRVAALQNFTKASEELGYSQSNVSVQIAQLEKDVGFSLFDRIGKNVHLTSYGEALIPYAQRIISDVIEMETFMKSDDLLGGVIHVGMANSLFELLLEKVLLNYHRRFPLVRLELSLDATTSLEDDLRHGKLDMACLIGDPLPKTDWTIWRTVEVPIVLVANRDHPLSGKESVTLEEIVNQEVILMEGSAPYSRQFETVLAAHDLTCQPFLRLQSAETALRLVQRGQFISLLPLYSVQAAIQDGSLSRLHVPDWNATQYVQMVLYHGKAITPQIRGFMEELSAILNDVLLKRLNPLTNQVGGG